MKMMFYVATLHGGGAERVMVNLANEFSEKKNDVYLVTDYIFDDEYEIQKDVKRQILKNYNGKSRIAKNLVQICSLRKLIKNIRPNVIISFLPENNIRAHFANININVKHVVSLRNSPKKVFSSSASGKLVQYVFKKADTIIVQTDDAKRWIEQNLHRKANIIMNQVDESFFKIKRNEKNNIIAVGKFLPQKNHALLIHAFSIIADQINENLIIYGEGKLREKYQSLIHELNMDSRIFLPGFSDNMQEIYAECKLFVLSSDYEGMPNVLLEAMAAGTPCISTNCPCGGPKMIIKDGINGCLVECNDSLALAETILFCLKNDEIRKKMGENASKTAQAFKPDTIFKTWEKILE